MEVVRLNLPEYQAPSIISPTVKNEEASLDEILSWLSEKRLSLGERRILVSLMKNSQRTYSNASKSIGRANDTESPD
jgi:hypothetical protein